MKLEVANLVKCFACGLTDKAKKNKIIFIIKCWVNCILYVDMWWMPSLFQQPFPHRRAITPETLPLSLGIFKL